MSQKRPKIAVIQWYTQEEELDDLYYYAIRIGLEKRAQELGFDIIRFFNDEPLTFSDDISGVIAIGKFSQKQLNDLKKFSPHLIVVDSDTLKDGISCVTTDFINSVTAVIDHFISQGLDKIGMIAGEEKTADAEKPLIDQRFRTFKSYLTESGLYKPKYVYIGPFSSQSGYDLMKKAITELDQDLPQAFFVANDSLAVGALKALQERQIPVPDRVSLISFNDTPITKQVFPALSSVTVYTEKMGRIAMDTLSQQLTSTDTDTPIMIKLATDLTLRDSSL